MSTVRVIAPVERDGTGAPPVPGDGGSRRAARPRRSREELHDIVLTAGREVLLSEGLGTGAEHLTFKKVLAHVEETQGIRVTNASVIRRIWDNQEEFQLEVVRSLVESQGDREVEASSDVLDEAIGRIDVSTPASRRASLAELIRVGCAAFLDAASGSDASIRMALGHLHRRQWDGRLGRALIESLPGDEPSADLGVRTPLRRRTGRLRLPDPRRPVAPRRGRHPLGPGRGRADADGRRAGGRPHRDVAPALDGVEVEWSLLAIGMNALVDFYAEPDPDRAG